MKMMLKVFGATVLMATTISIALAEDVIKKTDSEPAKQTEPLMQEEKHEASIDLIESQARMLTLTNKVMKVVVTDTKIAEALVESEHNILLNGRAEGITSVVITDGAGDSVTVKLRVKKNAPGAEFPLGGSLQGTIKEKETIPTPPGTIQLEEYKPTQSLDIVVSQSRVFKIANHIKKTAISDPGIAEPVLVSDHEINLIGKKDGATTLFIWDDAGGVVGVLVHVQAAHH